MATPFWQVGQAGAERAIRITKLSARLPASLAPLSVRCAPACTWLFRETLIEPFQERRPDADAATWEIFESQARAQLDRHRRADSDLLRALMLSTDGL
jgi:hypothetical protein